MHPLAVEIKIRKEVMTFNDRQTGNELKMSGIRVILGPKVEKFFILENFSTGQKGNAELLGYTNPNLVQWYYNSAPGAELILSESSSNSSELKKIYIKDENEL